jgi:hypothetical protein
VAVRHANDQPRPHQPNAARRNLDVGSRSQVKPSRTLRGRLRETNSGVKTFNL